VNSYQSSVFFSYQLSVISHQFFLVIASSVISYRKFGFKTPSLRLTSCNRAPRTARLSSEVPSARLHEMQYKSLSASPF